MFDKNDSTSYVSGINGSINYMLDGTTTSTYNQNAYELNPSTPPAIYFGGNTNGLATFTTTGIDGSSVPGEYFQIKYPFNYRLTSIVMRATTQWSRSPNDTYIFGSNDDGITWQYIQKITIVISTAVEEFTINVTNTNSYKVYRFVINTLRGGASSNAAALRTFRTNGKALLEI
jgi:hypothetical protein